MTMNCPTCGAIMVWLNGSISHNPPVKKYTCRKCNLNVVGYSNNTYEIVE